MTTSPADALTNDQQMDEKFLVSIIVITYNSEKYIIETLESAKAQTYKYLELLISDDGSKDRTVKICENWIERNSSRFVRIKIITVEKNTGIPANCNRGIKSARGRWVKIIAGDDILVETCIESNVGFVFKNKNSEIIFSKFVTFQDNLSFGLVKGKRYFESEYQERSVSFYNLPPKKQYRKLLQGNFLFAPTSFISIDIFKNYGYFDETIVQMEDYPFWLRLAKAGVYFRFLEKVTVEYRRSGGNVTGSIGYHLAMKRFFFRERAAALFMVNPLIFLDQFIFYLLIPFSFRFPFLKVLYLFSPLYWKKKLLP